jgi:hypothetical protein
LNSGTIPLTAEKTILLLKSPSGKSLKRAVKKAEGVAIIIISAFSIVSIIPKI